MFKVEDCGPLKVPPAFRAVSFLPSIVVQSRLYQKFHQPVDEDAQLGAEVPVRRIDDVQRDDVRGPGCEDRKQRPAGNMILQHESRRRGDAETRERRRHIGAAVVDGDDVASMYLMLLVAAREVEDVRLSRYRVEKPTIVMVVFQIRG